jgi:glycosyltransferase involved in cell wall biosynthesis
MWRSRLQRREGSNGMITVSVVIPAYNAASHLAATLQSASAQTVRDLEIIVVDDGSNDDTSAVGEALAASDDRIRVIRCANGGVARARNIGIAQSRGRFVAPLDADDLWHPRKLELQLKRFQERPDAGLVYNWFRRIDEADRVIVGSACRLVEGWVLHRLLLNNFIANGSTPLIRRELLDDIRYDAALRDAGNGGCEDYLLQLQLALRVPFACAPAFLTGYRRTVGAMSFDVGRMIRSNIQVLETIEPHVPKSARPVVRWRLAGFQMELARNRARRGAFGKAALAVGKALSLDVVAVLQAPQAQLTQRLAARAGARAPKSHSFLAWPVADADAVWREPSGRLDTLCARLDLEARTPPNFSRTSTCDRRPAAETS